MNLFKKFKKGFTLVELVVVVAVIGVLAGVGVAVYAGITKNAKESADDQIITQLNTQLRAKGVLEKNYTAYDAYLDACEIGFDLKKMTPTTGGFYVWDQEHDLFGIGVGSGDSFSIKFQDKTTAFTTKKNMQFIFTKNITGNETRGWFALGDEYASVPELQSSFDAGDAKISSPVTFKGTGKGESYTIRTNESDLVINASADDIQHYGIVKDLIVTAVSGNSYHERGYLINLVSFGSGKFDVEEKAKLCQSLAEVEGIVGNKFGKKGNANQYEQDNPIIPEDPYAELAKKYADKTFIIIDNGVDSGTNMLPIEVKDKQNYKILVNKNAVEIEFIANKSNIEIDLRGYSVSLSGDGVVALANPTCITFSDTIGGGSLIAESLDIVNDNLMVINSGNYVIDSLGAFGVLLDGTINFKGGSINGKPVIDMTEEEWLNLNSNIEIQGLGTNNIVIKSSIF